MRFYAVLNRIRQAAPGGDDAVVGHERLRRNRGLTVPNGEAERTSPPASSGTNQADPVGRGHNAPSWLGACRSGSVWPDKPQGCHLRGGHSARVRHLQRAYVTYSISLNVSRGH